MALKILKETKRVGDGGGCSGSAKMTKLWKIIWNLNCPSKIKHFMWRTFRNILPTNHCLKKRIALSDECVLCGERETTCHILWNCKIAIEVWKESCLKLPNGIPPQGEFIDLVWKLMEKPIDIDWELFATITWGLWKNRNAFKHEGRSKQAKSIAMESGKYVEEFRQSNMTNPKPPKQPFQARPQWCPPKPGWYKINVDGAVFKDPSCYEIGVITKNERGQIMGAMSKKLPLPWGGFGSGSKGSRGRNHSGKGPGS